MDSRMTLNWMNRMKRTVFAVFTSLALLIGNGLTVSAADAVSVDQKLPTNVMLYFSFPNVTEFKAQFQKTSAQIKASSINLEKPRSE